MGLRRLSFGLLVIGFGLAAVAAQVKQQPRFRIEIQAEAEGGPKFTVTNLSDKTLTACHIEFSVSSEGRREGGMSWDPIVQAGNRQRPQPLEPGASVTLNLPHRVGGPLPDKIEVVAGIWEDGETFGAAVWVKQLLDSRAGFASAYEQAIAFLQRGLDENWTHEQYLAGLNSKPDSLPIYAIRSTLQANQRANEKTLRAIVKSLQEYFTRNLNALRQAKPIKEGKQGSKGICAHEQKRSDAQS